MCTFYVCLCMRVLMYMHVACVCVHVCEDQETTLLFCLRHHSPYFWRQGLLLA